MLLHRLGPAELGVELLTAAGTQTEASPEIGFLDPVDLDELRSFVEGMAEALADDAIRERLEALLSTIE